MKYLLSVVALFIATAVHADTKFNVSNASTKFVVTVLPEDETPRLTYTEAFNRSLETGKPLVIWVGGNFCPECVKAESVDFVHYFTDFFPGCPAPGIVVGLPKTPGVGGSSVENVAVITSWPDGHIPTVRASIKAFKEGGIVRRDVVAYAGGGFGPAPMMQAAPMMQMAPMMQAAPMMQVPMMRMGAFRGGRGRGGCAS